MAAGYLLLSRSIIAVGFALIAYDIYETEWEGSARSRGLIVPTRQGEKAYYKYDLTALGKDVLDRLSAQE